MPDYIYVMQLEARQRAPELICFDPQGNLACEENGCLDKRLTHHHKAGH